MATLCIANQKGGVGKTTTAVTLAAGLARRGRRVLLVDLDIQGSASAALGVSVPEGGSSVADVLISDRAFEDVIQPTSTENLSGRWTYIEAGETAELELRQEPGSGDVTGTLAIFGKRAPIEGKFVIHWRKMAGDWKIDADIWNTDD